VLLFELTERAAGRIAPDLESLRQVATAAAAAGPGPIGGPDAEDDVTAEGAIDVDGDEPRKRRRRRRGGRRRAAAG